VIIGIPSLLFGMSSISEMQYDEDVKETDDMLQDARSSDEINIISSDEKIVTLTSEDVKYDITGGYVVRIIPDAELNIVTVIMSASHDGSLVITFPRSLFDAKSGDQDDVFLVLVDAEEVNFEETITSTDRTLAIQFPAGTEEIEIIGTILHHTRSINDSDIQKESSSNEGSTINLNDSTNDKHVNLNNVDLQILAKDIHGLLNLERQKQNLPELQWDEKLSSVAVLRNADYVRQYHSYGDITHMDDPKFLERVNQDTTDCYPYSGSTICKVVTRPNHDYDYCGTSEGVQLAKDIDKMESDLDNLESSIEIKSNQYDDQLREYQLYGSDSQYDLVEKTRLEYNSLIEKQEQQVTEYNTKIAIFNKMVEEGKIMDSTSEQINRYPSENYDATTYVELVHDMTTITIQTETWNATSGKMEPSYTYSSLFDYLYNEEEYHSMEKYTQKEGIGMSLSDDLLFMTWYRC
jgi:hypothetical protein